MDINDIKLCEIGLLAQCDFRCPYCISEQEFNWEGFPEINDDILINFINNMLPPETVISLTGGEPLLWTGLEKVITECPDRLFVIASNISHITEREWLLTPSESLKGRIAFRVGWHPNVRKDDFLEKINAIKDAGYHYVVNYMVDGIDRKTGPQERIQYLKDNNIEYEVTSEEVEYNIIYDDDYISAQYKLPNFIDNDKFLRVNCDGLVYDCYIGELNGTIKEGDLNFTEKNKKPYCRECLGLKGYTKILSQWDKIDFLSFLPIENRVTVTNSYDVFMDKVKYLDIIDEPDAREQVLSYVYKY